MVVTPGRLERFLGGGGEGGGVALLMPKACMVRTAPIASAA